MSDDRLTETLNPGRLTRCMAISQQPSFWSTDHASPSDAAPSHHEDSLSTVLAEMLAKMKGVEPTQEGFHLYEYINPDAIDALNRHAEGHENTNWQLEFEAGDVSVVVRSDGVIRTSLRR